MRGVIHCHSHFSHDSTGTESELVGAATAVGLDFVIMTDHPNDPRAVRDGIRGWRRKTLFIVGQELKVSGLGSLLAVDLERRVEGRDAARKIEQTVALASRTSIAKARQFPAVTLTGPRQKRRRL